MPGCGDTVSAEFKAESASLSYEDPSVFVKSQWPLNQKVYIVYRILAAVALTAWVIADVLIESQTFYSSRPWQWFIFATNWAFIILALSATYKAVATICYSRQGATDKDDNYFHSMPVALKIEWALHSLASNAAIVVTISYWCFIAFLDHADFLNTRMSEMKHTANTVYVIVDLMIIASPVRILHLLITVVVGSIYTIFNAIYFLNSGTLGGDMHYTYSVLDWANPAKALITCLVATVEAVFSQLVLYLLYNLRRWLFSKIYFENGQSSREAELKTILSPPQTGYKSVETANYGE